MSFHTIPVPLQHKLKRAGYETMEQLVSLDMPDIAKELHLSLSENEQLLKAIGKERVKRDELDQNEQLNSISTQSKNIDSLFGSGIPPQKITEICGEAGTGKTQLCMQLGIRSLSKGGCVYIDAEGSCALNGRLHDISNPQEIDSFHLFRVTSHAEFMAIITQLPDILEDFPDTKLIVIDSIAFHFRINVLTKPVRDGLLNYIGSMLLDIAREKNLPVVVVNHVTQEDESSAWIPSLGPAWGNWCSNRLFLYRKRNFRFAYLYRVHDTTVNRPVQFCIKDHGISDPVEDEIELVSEGQTQKQIDSNIEFSFTQLRQEIDEADEQQKVDDFWNEAYMDIAYESKSLNETQASQKSNSQAAVESISNTQVKNEENFIPATQIASYEEDDFISATQIVESKKSTKAASASASTQIDQAKEDAMPWHGSDSQELNSIPKKPPIFNEPSPMHGSVNRSVNESIHNSQMTKESLFSPQGNPNLVLPEEEPASSQDVPSILSLDDQPVISAFESMDNSNVGISASQEKLNEPEEIVYSTEKHKLKTLYPNHEIIYTTQGKPVIYETDCDGYLYSTQDKSALKKIYPDIDIIPHQERSKNTAAVIEKMPPLPENSSLSNDKYDTTMSSMSSLSSKEEEDIPPPELKKTDKRKLCTVDINSDEFSGNQQKKPKNAVSGCQSAGSKAGTEAALEITEKPDADDADWDSDEEEELDYKYIEEMDDYL